MATFHDYIVQCSQTAPQSRRKVPGKRRRMLILQNRSANDVYVGFDQQPTQDLVAGLKVAVNVTIIFDVACPDNEVIWYMGSNGATVQNFNVVEGFE